MDFQFCLLKGSKKLELKLLLIKRASSKIIKLDD